MLVLGISKDHENKIVTTKLQLYMQKLQPNLSIDQRNPKKNQTNKQTKKQKTKKIA